MKEDLRSRIILGLRARCPLAISHVESFIAKTCEHRVKLTMNCHCAHNRARPAALSSLALNVFPHGLLHDSKVQPEDSSTTSIVVACIVA